MSEQEHPGGALAPQVREWAERRGLIEPGSRGRLPSSVWAAHAMETAATQAAAEPARADASEDAPPPLAVPPRELPAVPVPREEKPPETPGKETVADKAKRLWAGDKGGKHEDKPAKAGKPERRAPRKRVSLETLGGLTWVGIAKSLAFIGDTYAPVTRVMAFQAPVAGAVMEDLARDTVVDKFAQPIARLTESGGAVGALVGMPLLTAVVCRQPALYPQVRPMMMGAMKEWVIVAGPKLRDMRRREEKFAEEMGTFAEEFGITPDDLLDEIFRDFAVQHEAAAAAAGANGSGP